MVELQYGKATTHPANTLLRWREEIFIALNHQDSDVIAASITDPERT